MNVLVPPFAHRERPEWYDAAACRSDVVQIGILVGEIDFYATTRRHWLGETGRAALRVCESCPVRVLCAQEGEVEAHGIWGGLTERERSRARGEAKRRAA